MASEDTSGATVPQYFKNLQKKNKVLELLWRSVHYLLGSLVTVIAAVIGADPQSLPPDWGQQFALLAAALAGLLTFLQPGARANAYREARNVLHFARNRHEKMDDDLSAAMEDARRILRGV